MSIHISYDMYLRLGLHVQIRLYYVLPYKAKISAQHGIGFILDRCIVYLRLTMPNLQKKHQLLLEIFNIKKCILFFSNRVYELYGLDCNRVNTVEIGENTDDHYFLLFPQYSRMHSSYSLLKWWFVC